MRFALLAVLPLLAGLTAAPPRADRSVAYTLEPEMRGDAIVALRVTLSFDGDASGTTTVDWADGWAGERHLAQWSRDIVVEGAARTDPAAHGGRIVHAAPGAPLTVRYRIVSAYDADPTVDNSEEPRPVVRPGWFYAVGEALFAVPQGRDDAPARFAWHGPAGIAFASDLEHEVGPRGKPKTLDDITESIVVGGRDLHVATGVSGGATVRVARIGRYDFDAAAFDALALKVVAVERGFWRETRAGPFLITMSPLVPVAGRLSYGGTGRSDAFATWVDPGSSLSGLTWLLAHEYFHSWNPRQLGRLPDGDEEGRAYWLSEGFTDFYARRLMLRDGLSTPTDFVASWNDALRDYAVSSYRTRSNAEVAAAFWRDEQAQKMPYQRGAMLAALWDRRLRLRSGGRTTLDTVLLGERDAARPRAELPPLTSGFVAAATARHLDVRADMARYVDRGAALLLPADTFGECARVATEDRPVFERGWDADATSTAGNVLTGVDPASAAYAAGLRDGMRIAKRIAGTPGDSTVDYVVEIDDRGTRRTVRFRPAGKTIVRMQQIVLDTVRFAATPDACRAALAG